MIRGAGRDQAARGGGCDVAGERHERECGEGQCGCEHGFSVADQAVPIWGVRCEDAVSCEIVSAWVI